MNESESSDDYEPAVNAEEEDSDSDGPTPAKVVHGSGRARGRARVRAAPCERAALRGHAALRGRGRRARVDPETIVPEPGWRKTADADPPTVAAFTAPQGPTTPLPANTPLISFFCQIFGDDFFNHLAAATNENAATKAPPTAGVAGAEVDANVTSDRRWHATNSEEMKAFIAINIIMGIKDLSVYVDYWSTDPILHDPFVANIMPRRRYEKLCQFMHCSIAADEDRADKLTKVRPLITLCQRNFNACFAPSKDLSVDEAMVQFDGRLSWKQYLPNKPVKWGIKLWCLCDAATGYCLAFMVYTGAETGDVAPTHDLGYRVVMELMSAYLNQQRHVYADNYFTTVTLAKELLRCGTYLCGTTRSHRREFPKSLASATLQPGESLKWTNDDGVMLLKWRDKRDVFMVATNDAGLDEVKRVRQRNVEVDLPVPTCVKRYNGLMGEVDRLDQLRAYYSVGHSGKRWWKYIFWGLLNIGIINAYILWKMANQHLPAHTRATSLKVWKLRLIHDMVDSYETTRVARRTVKGRFVESRFGCDRCKAYLCGSGPCFLAYHQ